MYSRGEGVEPDEYEAEKYFLQAANNSKAFQKEKVSLGSFGFVWVRLEREAQPKTNLQKSICRECENFYFQLHFWILIHSARLKKKI